jgi:hypothetical protein
VGIQGATPTPTPTPTLSRRIFDVLHEDLQPAAQPLLLAGQRHASTDRPAITYTSVWFRHF